MRQDSKSKQFDLKLALLYSTGIKYPVSGGVGLSKDDPIVIEETSPDIATSCEMSVAKEVCGFYRFSDAELKLQSIMPDEDRVLDVLQFSYNDPFFKAQEATLYFDITIPYASRLSAGFSQPNEVEDRIRSNTQKRPEMQLQVFPFALGMVLNELKEHPFEIEHITRYVDDDEAKLLMAALKRCNALEPGVRGMARKYKEEGYAKHLETDKPVTEVAFVHTLSPELQELLRKRKGREEVGNE